MDTALVDRIINSVLYEGYLLYPYRRSMKNAKRWMFGSLYPREGEQVSSGGERCTARSRCLLVGSASTTIEGEVRFLQMIERRPTGGEYNALDCWQESTEQRIAIAPLHLKDLNSPRSQSFTYPHETAQVLETAADSNSPIETYQEAVAGTIEMAAKQVADDVYLLTVSVSNDSTIAVCDESRTNCGDTAALQSFVSTHLVLHTGLGEFVSRIDPPAEYRELLYADAADGLWPVLIGGPGQRDTMLCSPIILYDHPEIAPESPGDFFDGTEMDEMLTLRILTLSEQEQRAVAALDARGRAVLRRTQEMSTRQLEQLHGVIRSLRRVKEEPHV